MKCIFLNKNVWILIKISLTVFPTKGIGTENRDMRPTFSLLVKPQFVIGSTLGAASNDKVGMKTILAFNPIENGRIYM